MRVWGTEWNCVLHIYIYNTHTGDDVDGGEWINELMHVAKGFTNRLQCVRIVLVIVPCVSLLLMLLLLQFFCWTVRGIKIWGSLAIKSSQRSRNQSKESMTLLDSGSPPVAAPVFQPPIWSRWIRSSRSTSFNSWTTTSQRTTNAFSYPVFRYLVSLQSLYFFVFLISLLIRSSVTCSVQEYSDSWLILIFTQSYLTHSLFHLYLTYTTQVHPHLSLPFLLYVLDTLSLPSFFLISFTFQEHAGHADLDHELCFVCVFK